MKERSSGQISFEAAQNTSPTRQRGNYNDSISSYRSLSKQQGNPLLALWASIETRNIRWWILRLSKAPRLIFSIRYTSWLMSEPNPDSDVRQFIFVALCFFLSGFAALLYETVWLRQFAILVGTSEQALAIVLASYMGGLALGAAVAGTYVRQIRRPLLTYGVLELLIAVSALLMPLGLWCVRYLQASLFGGLPEPPAAGGLAQGVFTFCSVFGLIAIPTGLMGATLPLLARFAVHEDQQIGPRIGMLYAINTFGAVGGTMSAAFLFLPRLGLAKTIWIGAAINLAVFAVVVLIVRQANKFADDHVLADSHEEPASSETPTINDDGEHANSDRKAILILIGFSGAISFCYEIIFTRMLGHVLGGSIFSFATMLASFLLGIALGGAIASRFFCRTRGFAKMAFIYAQVLIGIAALFAFRSLDSIAENASLESMSRAMGTIPVGSSILALLPTSTFIGTTFPLAIRIFARNKSQAASGSGIVYSWNVVGGILGATFTGMFLLPLLQYQGATMTAVAINILLAAVAALAFRVPRPHLGVCAVGLVFFLLMLPMRPEKIMRVSALDGSISSGQMLFDHVGQSATVAVIYDRGNVHFQTNGLSEARLLPRESGLLFASEANWLTALPPLLRPDMKSMLVIGLGGGAALEQLAPSLQSVDVIELEPAVVDGNRAVAPLRTNDPLSDPRVRVILNDGRNALTLTDKRYDSIVSQPSHPWTAGASHLYTKEFAEIVRPRLNPGGVFLQWMSSAFVNADLVNSMGATLLDVFPHVRMYQPQKGLFLFVASDEPIRPEALAAKSNAGPDLCVLPDTNRQYYRRLGVLTRTHLAYLLSLDERGIREMCDGAPIVKDEQNLLAMRAPALIREPTDEAIRRVHSFTPIRRGLDAMRELCPRFDPVAYSCRVAAGGRSEMLGESVLALVDDAADREYCSMIMSDGSWEDEKERVVALHLKYPDDQRFAFMVLRMSMIGRLPGVTESQQEKLKSKLSESQLDLVNMMEATFRGEFEVPRSLDAKVAAVSPDSVEFDTMISMRIPWRLETAPPNAAKRGAEALEIIDDNMVFLRATDVSFFRVIAAIKAGRPFAALGGVSVMTTKAERLLREGKLVESGKNLARIRQVLADRNLFQGVPAWKYKEVTFALDRVLQSIR